MKKNESLLKPVVSFSRTVKRIIPAAITGISILLSACAASSSPSVSPQIREIGGSSSHTESNYADTLDISIGYWDIDSLTRESSPDGVLDYLQKRFHVHFSFVPTTWSNYQEKYRMLALTDSLPDIFSTITLSSGDPTGSATYASFIDNRKIRALPDDLSHWPNVYAIVNSMPSARYQDGHTYLTPRRIFSDPDLGIADAAMIVRKDWMDHLGISDPSSMQEFEEMIRAFVYDDPDGNGKDDTIGYNVNTQQALGKWVILGLHPELNTLAWTERNGKYVPTWAVPEYSDIIALFRKFYSEGILDSEFYTKSPASVEDDFAAGRLGAFEFKSSPASLRQLEDRWDLYQTKSFYDCVKLLPIFPTAEGKRYSNSSNPIWSESYFSSSVSEEKMTRILDLYEYLLSEEGQLLINYGLEGTDYRLNQNGNVEVLLSLSTNQRLSSVLLSKYPSLSVFSSLAEWLDQDWNNADSRQLYTMKYGERNLNMALDSLTWYRNNTIQISRPYSFLNAPRSSNSSFNSSNVSEEIIRCIVGTDDPIKSWNSYLNSLYQRGLGDYIEEQNLLYTQSTESEP